MSAAVNAGAVVAALNEHRSDGPSGSPGHDPDPTPIFIGVACFMGLLLLCLRVYAAITRALEIWRNRR